MMGKRSLALLVFVPIGVYLLTMILIAALVTHPPALGWVGLGAASAIGLLAGAAALRLFARTRTNSVRTHPHPGPLYRLLVVADTDVEPAELVSAVRLRLLERDAEVHLVAPVVPSAFHFFTDDEEHERAATNRRLEKAQRALAAAGIEARGMLGTDDPLQATADALAGFRADEILLVGTLEPARSWLDDDFEARARDLFDIPVATVYGRAPAMA